MRKLLALVTIIFTVSLGTAALAGIDEGIDAFNGRNYKEAWSIFKPLADADDPTAAYYVGFMTYHSLGIPKDKDNEGKGFILLRKAANLGNPAAQGLLGYLYEQSPQGKGTGMRRKLMALKWYSLSKSGGDKIYGEPGYNNLLTTRPERKVTVATLCLMGFRVKPVKQTSEQLKSWRERYYEFFKNIKTVDDYLDFTAVYSEPEDDPDGLKEKARQKINDIRNKEIRDFRARLKTGAETNCGRVIEIKKPLVHIQTSLNTPKDYWFNIEKEVFPPNLAKCVFINNAYQIPNDIMLEADF